MKGGGWVVLALALGFWAGVWTAGRGAEDPGVSPATRDSLAVALTGIAYLEEARTRAVSKSRADSLALAAVTARVRVRAIPPASSVDTVTIPDTLMVYDVPAPVVRLVESLERRVAGLVVALDTTTLQLYAERNARELAQSIARQAEGALAAERARRWRYRLEGAGLVGIIFGLASAIR